MSYHTPDTKVMYEKVKKKKGKKHHLTSPPNAYVKNKRIGKKKEK